MRIFLLLAFARRVKISSSWLHLVANHRRCIYSLVGYAHISGGQSQASESKQSGNHQSRWYIPRTGHFKPRAAPSKPNCWAIRPLISWVLSKLWETKGCRPCEHGNQCLEASCQPICNQTTLNALESPSSQLMDSHPSMVRLPPAVAGLAISCLLFSWHLMHPSWWVNLGGLANQTTFFYTTC